MDESEEVTGPVRKTRSGRPVRGAAVAAPKPKPSPKSARKTRKKVVMVEVEVTDEEDNAVQNEDELLKESDDEKIIKKDVESDEETLLKNEDVVLNDSKKNGNQKVDDVNASLILNDIEMLEETPCEEKQTKNEEEKTVINDQIEPVKETETVEEAKPVKETETVKEAETVKEPELVKETELIKEAETVKEPKPVKVTETPPEKMEVELDEEFPSKEDQEVSEEKSAGNKTESVEAKETEVTEKHVEKSEKETEEKEPKESEDVQMEEAKVEEKQPSQPTEGISDEMDTSQQNGDPDAENISEDELPGVPVVKVPETEEVSDEELPGPKRAELPADTEVVSEDELPTVKKESEDELSAKKEGTKRKLGEGDDYDPDSPTSENEAPTKKPTLDTSDKEKEKDEKPAKPKKLPELDKYWKAVNDDPSDFTGWTYLLQYVDQENDMEAAREAYDAFLSHYPYCYGYWRKYADYEKRKGNKKKCEEVFERGLKAIPLSVDLWIHYLTYVKSNKPDDEDYIRSQFERALAACGLEFRSDRLWDSYIKWETEGKRLQKVTALYDRLLATPTQGYTTHFDNFQEHISANSPNKVIELDEFMALRKEVRNVLKQDAAAENPAENADIPPGDEEVRISSEEETKCIKERIVSIRRKTHKNTVNAVTARWNFEEGIKRPYFHVKPLERCQLKNWQDYLDYEIEQGDIGRTVVLFERCLIACALYEEFWLKFVHYLENLKDEELLPKIRDVYERACTIHHLKKPNLHLQWAMFEESVDNANRAAEILVNLEKSVPNVLQVAYRRINLERRRADHEKCSQLFEHYISNSKNKMISSNIAIKYSRFTLKVQKDIEKAQEILKLAISKDTNNPRLYLQLIDLTLQKEAVTEEDVCGLIDEFLEKETADADQKVLFAQRKLEYLEDFGSSIKNVQAAYEQYQKYIKLCKESGKKKETKSESSTSKKEKPTPPSSSQPGSYNNYNYTSSSQPSYPYSGSTQGQYGYSGYQAGDQYQYQNWQYPQGSYGTYNQWGGYSGGYGY